MVRVNTIYLSRVHVLRLVLFWLLNWFFSQNYLYYIPIILSGVDTTCMFLSQLCCTVPFMMVWLFKKGEFYHILGDESPIVLFKPREWRGSSSNTSKQNLFTSLFAKEDQWSSARHGHGDLHGE